MDGIVVELRSRARPLPLTAGVTAGLLVLTGSLWYVTRAPDAYADPPLADVDCRGGVTVTIASSPEKFDELKRIAGQFNAFRCDDTAAVTITRISSGEALRQLRDGTWSTGARPQVWTPAATSWVRRLQHSDAGAVTNAGPGGDLPSVTRTPLVLAMPQPIADQVSGTGGERSVGWETVVNWARDPASWQRDTGGRWGDFKVGRTDPGYSTSGLHSLLATFTVAAGHAPQPADLAAVQPTVEGRRVQDGVRAVERAAVHYGDTTLYYLCALAQADRSAGDVSADALRKVTEYVSAVPVEEKSVYEYNTGNLKDCPAAAGYRPKIELTAVHPADGTVWSDSPYAILAAASDDQRLLARNFLRYLHDKDAPDDPAYRAPQAVFLTAGFRALLTTGLGVARPADAGLRETLGPAPIAHPGPAVVDDLLSWWSRNRKPAKVLFVVDVSGSMLWEPDSTTVAEPPDRRIDQVARALEPALSGLDERIQVGMWTFSGAIGQPQVERVDRVAPVGTGVPALRNMIRNLRPRPDADTALYDAITEARAELGPVSKDSIAAVVVLTDGQNDICAGKDTACHHDQQRKLEALTSGPRDRVRVFTIAYSAQAPAKILDAIAAGNETRQAGTTVAGGDATPVDLAQLLAAVTRNF